MKTNYFTAFRTILLSAELFKFIHERDYDRILHLQKLPITLKSTRIHELHFGKSITRQQGKVTGIDVRSVQHGHMLCLCR
jgi:hypothetical protein